MRKSKGIVSILIVALLVATMSVPALAYQDGDREVLYYSFSISGGDRVGRSSSSMPRLYDREWVVSISSRSGNDYPITYAMITGQNTEWSYALVSNTASRTGTGNTGSTYPSTASIGYNLHLGSLISAYDVNKNVQTSGQWSTDAPW